MMSVLWSITAPRNARLSVSTDKTQLLTTASQSPDQPHNIVALSQFLSQKMCVNWWHRSIVNTFMARLLYFLKICIIYLTLSMLKLLSSKVQEHNIFWKSSKILSCWYSLERSHWVLNIWVPICARVSVILWSLITSTPSLPHLQCSFWWFRPPFP